MSATLRGFPSRFPVRSDGRRSLRYHAVSFSSRMVLRSFFGRRLRVENIESVPLQGPLLLVSNHLSNIDPFLFGGFVPGTMYCMAKRELFRMPLVAWVLAGCNCFPVARHAADRWAMRTALAVLHAGGRLLIFVEGTRSHRPGMQRVEPGVGFLARRSGAAVVPVGVWGTERVFSGSFVPRPAEVTVRFGEPFRPPPAEGRRHDDRAVADAIAQRIGALLPPEYRGVYGGAGTDTQVLRTAPAAG